MMSSGSGATPTVGRPPRWLALARGRCVFAVGKVVAVSSPCPGRRRHGFARAVVVSTAHAVAQAAASARGGAFGLKSGIHAANSKSHVHSLPADDAAAAAPTPSPRAGSDQHHPARAGVGRARTAGSSSFGVQRVRRRHTTPRRVGGTLALANRRGLAKKAAAGAKGKSAGPDGIPAEYFHCMLDQVKEDLTAYYNEMFDERTLTTGMLCGEIILLYKKKDPRDVRNYRPITLLNNDYKILMRILALRMNEAVVEVYLQPSGWADLNTNTRFEVPCCKVRLQNQ